jgi:hypothetical protein
VGIARIEGRQVAAHVRIERQLTALHQLHDRDIGEELGDGTDAVHRFRRRGDTASGVRPAKPARPYDALAVHQRDGQRGDFLVAHFVRDHGFQLLRQLRIPRVGRDSRLRRDCARGNERGDERA